MGTNVETIGSTSQTYIYSEVAEDEARLEDLYRLTATESQLDETDDLQQVATRERIYRRCLALADAAVVLAVLSFTFGVIGGHQLRWPLLLVAPAFLFAGKIQGLYDHDELVIRKSTLDEIPRLLSLCTVASLFVWLLREEFEVGNSHAPHVLLALWGSLSIAVPVGRVIARAIAERLSPTERCLVVGDSALLERLRSKLTGRQSVKLVGAVSTSTVAPTVAGLRSLASSLCIHRLIIAPERGMGEAETLDLVRAAKATGLRVSLFPGIMGAVGSSVVFDDFGGLTLLGVPRFGLTRSSRAVKRGLDLIGAGVGLIAMAPLMIIAAIAIKLESPGGVFFRQTRVGRGGKRFQVLKFRSMVDGADAMKAELLDQNEADGLFKIADDPRITRVGRLLRETHLDELPQLINIIRGEMSLVGPRPLVVDEDEQITGLDRRRLHLTPGMTGPWQILGPTRVPLSEMVKLDYLYVAHWSLWADVKILLQTCGVIFNRKGL